MKKLVEVVGLKKHFPISGSKKVVQAINNISFHVMPGETVGLVGESGSGKTTVGRCLLGLTDVTDGSILFQDQDLAGPKVRKQHLGDLQIVFQESMEALNPRLPVFKSVEEPLTTLGLDAAARAERVREVIDRVGLSQRLGKLYPAELTGGQLQRIGIARAIVTRPKLLVLDEPTSMLDPTSRADIIELLIALQADLGMASLFISHDLSTVRHVSQRVAVMYLGMIVEQGPAREVFGRPRHPYTVGLLSSVLLPNPELPRPVPVELKGEIPSPIDLPTGCFLASRCPLAIDQCRAAMPPAHAVGEDHFVHCIRHEELGHSDEMSRVFDAFERETERILSFGARTH